MQTLGAMIHGDHLFEGASDFSGMIKGDATLAPGARLRLQGMVKGALIVSPDAWLDLTGMVKGDLIVEQGGHAQVTGVVLGDVVNCGGTVDPG